MWHDEGVTANNYKSLMLETLEIGKQIYKNYFNLTTTVKCGFKNVKLLEINFNDKK